VSDEVRELSRLLDEWDPIGVYGDWLDLPGPGEYDRLIGPVLTKLRSGDDPGEIATFLTWDETTNMGLRGQPEKALAAALRIHAWFHATTGHA
jgi:hypothetical protein